MEAKAKPARAERVVTVASLAASLATTGVAVWMFLPPLPLPDLSEHIYWYLGRSTGLIAYWLLFLSVALGIAISSRVFDGMLNRAWVYDIHKFLSLFVLLAMAFHALILLPDPWAKFTIVELTVPFKSHYRPTAVALGTMVLYGSAIMSGSFYLKRFIGQKAWRWLHYGTFALLGGALAHGVLSGTDTKAPAVQVSYLVSGVLVLFLTLFRILVTRAAGGKPRAERPAARPPAEKAAPVVATAASPVPHPVAQRGAITSPEASTAAGP